MRAPLLVLGVEVEVVEVEVVVVLVLAAGDNNFPKLSERNVLYLFSLAKTVTARACLLELSADNTAAWNQEPSC